mmetsp:Transcript_39145/g.87888  ORF Transcript_39145/g.87888 Transcript_39145/m.87888 type:complete len:186 (+) Transcript_39145:462-1019(+)
MEPQRATCAAVLPPALAAPAWHLAVVEQARAQRRSEMVEARLRNTVGLLRGNTKKEQQHSADCSNAQVVPDCSSSGEASDEPLQQHGRELLDRCAAIEKFQQELQSKVVRGDVSQLKKCLADELTKAQATHAAFVQLLEAKMDTWKTLDELRGVAELYEPLRNVHESDREPVVGHAAAPGAHAGD